MSSDGRSRRNSVIGASLPRPDAMGKVTGATAYPADLVKPGMLHLKVVFAQRAHARIRTLAIADALHTPGVVAVLTARDVPYNAYGLIDEDQPVLCDEKVRFSGDRIALVIAESKGAALAGAQRVNVEYEDLPVVSDPRSALAVDAPLLYEKLGTNRLFHFPLRKGDVAKGFAQADIILEDTFTTNWQEHAFLQPEAGIAFVEQHDGQERVVIETAGQWLHEDRRQVAAILRLPEEQVVVRYAAIGGAFGGREDLSLQHLLALAAWRLKRPVALVWSRDESMIAHHKRHPFQIHCRWGAKRTGKIAAAEVELIADGGAYASTSVEVVKAATLFATGSYDVPNIKADGYAVYTNNVPSGAFRGFGAPQAQFAVESMVTRLAMALDIDPVVFRQANLYREDSIETTNEPLPTGVSAVPVFESCVAEARARWHYTEPQPSASPYLRQGIGLASGIKNVGYSFGFPEQATATVEVYGTAELERAVVRIGAADMGQGTHLALRQIAAAALKLSTEQVAMICTDSSQAPNAGSASASRMTFMGGRAVHDAALAAREKWSYTDDEQATATVQYHAPTTSALDPHTHSSHPNYCYGYAAQAVKVEVNIFTGQVQVQGIISVHDVGQAVNMQQVTGQIEGCLAQALGYTLLENFQVRAGRVLTPSFSTYLLPTTLDMPTEVIPVVLELSDPNGPFGARGMGEMRLVPFAGAVASAIYEATGVWVKDLPITPERVLAALKEKEHTQS